MPLIAGLRPAGVEVIVRMVAKVVCGLENILCVHRVARTCLGKTTVNDGTIRNRKRVLMFEIAERLAGSRTANGFLCQHWSRGRPSSNGGLGLHLSLLEGSEISVINSVGGDTLVILRHGRLIGSLPLMSLRVIKRIAWWALVGIIIFFSALGVPSSSNNHILLLPA